MLKNDKLGAVSRLALVGWFSILLGRPHFDRATTTVKVANVDFVENVWSNQVWLTQRKKNRKTLSFFEFFSKFALFVNLHLRKFFITPFAQFSAI